jgi:hypothetical protein
MVRIPGSTSSIRQQGRKDCHVGIGAVNENRTFTGRSANGKLGSEVPLFGFRMPMMTAPKDPWKDATDEALRHMAARGRLSRLRRLNLDSAPQKKSREVFSYSFSSHFTKG